MKKMLLSIAFLLTTSVSFAEDTSPWSYRVGLTQISPHVSSSDLSAPSFPGTKIDIGANTQLSGGVNYKLNEYWSIDVPLSLPFEHELYGAGAIQGVGKLGTVKVLPITALVQYQLNFENEALKPYVGVGFTYDKFYGNTGTAVLTSVTGGGFKSDNAKYSFEVGS